MDGLPSPLKFFQCRWRGEQLPNLELRFLNHDHFDPFECAVETKEARMIASLTVIDSPQQLLGTST